MVSHVQREQGGNAGNDGGEAKAGTGAADRGASPSFAEVEAFFAERQAEHLAKASQAYSFCFTQERALQGDWQWQAVTADGFTPASLDAPLHPEEVPAGAARPSVGAQTPTKCRPAVSQDPELPESRTPALKAKRARADVQPLKLTLRLRSSGSP